jgi:hypothetical protein
MSMLSEVRAKIALSSNTEFGILSSQPAMVTLWEQMQTLREEMNEAKKRAAKEAAIPYITLIENLETKYAILLRLSA